MKHLPKGPEMDEAAAALSRWDDAHLARVRYRTRRAKVFEQLEAQRALLNKTEGDYVPLYDEPEADRVDRLINGSDVARTELASVTERKASNDAVRVAAAQVQADIALLEAERDRCSDAERQAASDADEAHNVFWTALAEALIAAYEKDLVLLVERRLKPIAAAVRGVPHTAWQANRLSVRMPRVELRVWDDANQQFTVIWPRRDFDLEAYVPLREELLAALRQQ